MRIMTVISWTINRPLTLVKLWAAEYPTEHGRFLRLSLCRLLVQYNPSTVVAFAVAAKGIFQIENLNLNLFALIGAISPVVVQKRIFPVIASRELDAFIQVMPLLNTSLKISVWLNLKLHLRGIASIIQAWAKPIGTLDTTHVAYAWRC